MKPKDFEKQLGKVPIRAIPAAWREDILTAAHAAAATPEVRRAAARTWWRDLLWPCPQAWAGLAVAWVFILGTQIMLDWPRTSAVSQSAKITKSEPGELFITAGLSGRDWAKLIDADPVEPPKTGMPPRRSSIETNQSFV